MLQNRNSVLNSELDRKISHCAQTLRERAPAVDKEATIPSENFELLGQNDMLILSAPENCGGYDIGFGGNGRKEKVEILERIASACSNTAQCLNTHLSALGTISLLGDEKQIERFANEIIERNTIFSYYGSEPDQEFDTEEGDRIKYDTIVERNGDEWIIDGEKFFATNSLYADYHLVFAMEEDATDMSDLRVAIVPDDADGIAIHDSWDGMGQRATASGRVEFNSVRIPDDNVIGEPGALIESGIGGFGFQLDFAAHFVGIADGALRFTKRWLDEEAKPPSDLDSLSEDPHVQLRIGDMDIQVNAARELVREAARQLDAAESEKEMKTAGTAVYRSKVFASEVVVDISSRLFQITGARSTSKMYNSDRFWRDGRTLVLHDIIDKQKTKVARDVLGLESPTMSTR
ncbi:acyl-CoA dehydrogenase family protein [Natrinema halophilum]|uniref:acyl-CoA dehydrogenase family protein n=1 Tax=Natrinema halophilum TaxID=1699371 RepID=UPI001F3468C0|nr:acyl-CoA dehydrogenase family protein [Natrinema halophilum]UHQ96211.1 acyl-CoA dehydrogenase family protein [Natrinema halophilum]